ncbi:MAG: nitrilase-related carbon-nitrogen hydrolase [Bacteroidota bacterium]
MRTLRIAGAALNQTPIDWNHNLDNIRRAAAAAQREGADLICFSELAVTGYGCEDLFLSDWLSETAFLKLQELVHEFPSMTLCVGLPVRHQGVTYNGVAVLQEGRITGITLKQHLPGDGIHYEPRWFRPWPANQVIELQTPIGTVPAGDLVYTCGGITFAFEICEDAWVTQRPAEQLLQRGAELILNPSASHFAFGKSKVREAIVVNSSSRFNCTYMMVNQLGNEAGRVVYDGDVLMATRGTLVLRGPRLTFHPFSMQVQEVDFDDEPYIKAEADALDGVNEEFVQAAALALFDYLRKSRAAGFTLSLSGGADSSCCAVLVSEAIARASDELGWKGFWEALGKGDQVISNQRQAVERLLYCAYQATDNSSAATLHAASTLAGSIGATFHQWSVQEEVSGYRQKLETALGRELTWEMDDIALQNIQARARSPIIWMLANVTRSVLLTTSNRSEGDVGYATMDGDTSGSLAPIAGVSKPFILQWLRWAEQALGYDGLAPVNGLQPTAELRPAERAQTDEKDLMPYAVLVDIEREAIYKRQSPSQVYHSLISSGRYADAAALRGHVVRFFRLWSVNQWKRERLAPSFHFDDLNVDPRSWCRFPILSGGFDEELTQLMAE